ncbi:MAG: GIY-YIG nuclease family protein [Pseudomonadota bacterium]
MPREHHYYVYLLTSRPHGTLYRGVTNDLYRRLLKHRERKAAGFTQKYAVHRLVWFEEHSDIEEAIAREKAIKTCGGRGRSN